MHRTASYNKKIIHFKMWTVPRLRKCSICDYVIQYTSPTVWSVYSCLILVGFESKMKVIKTHILPILTITNCLLIFGLLLLSGQLDFHCGFLILVYGHVVTIGKQKEKHWKDPISWYWVSHLSRFKEPVIFS